MIVNQNVVISKIISSLSIMKKCNQFISHLAFPINYLIISILNRLTTSFKSYEEMIAKDTNDILNDISCASLVIGLLKS